MEDAREGHREKTQLARETSGISGTCDSTVSDQAVGRHMFRDKKVLGTIIAQVPRRARVSILKSTKSKVKLDTEKVTARWPTCPAAVCARFSWRRPIARSDFRIIHRADV